VRISKEIQEFASGKADGFDPGPAKRSPGLTEEQQRILVERGHLDSEEIHRLAGMTQQTIEKAPDGKMACHSDHVAAERARRLQQTTERE
jgi:phosphomethylpyrimidine synthase